MADPGVIIKSPISVGFGPYFMMSRFGRVFLPNLVGISSGIRAFGLSPVIFEGR